jgi:GxxExxY protein
MSENDDLLHGELTEKVIKAFYHIYNTLGYGFLEKVYENALAITLRKWGLEVQQQRHVQVYFECEFAGEFKADLLVNGVLIVELKSAESMDKSHEAQLLNYLRVTWIEVGLVLNFGPKPAFKRKIFTNDKKPHLSVSPVPHADRTIIQSSFNS